MKTIIQQIKILIATCLYVVLAGSPALADDTEIFMGTTDNEAGKAKVLLIIDNSKSMEGDATCSAGTVCDNSAKIEVVKKVLRKIMIDASDPFWTNPTDNPTATMANENFQGMKFAIMNFNANGNGNSEDGGKFVMQFKELDNTSVGSIHSDIDAIAINSSTPLAETLYEAARFYSSMAPDFGSNSTVLNKVTDTAGKYMPDFTGVCGGNNHIVLLTDGKPRNDADADQKIDALHLVVDDALNPILDANDELQSQFPFSIPQCNSTSRGSENSNNQTADNCLPLVSEYLYRRDFDGTTEVPTLAEGVTKDVHNNVVTHTIAFDLGDATATKLMHQTSTDCESYDPDSNPYSFISGTANAEGVIEDRNCRTFEASNAMDLEDAFKKFFTTVNDSTTTFTPPAASINSTNRLIHNNDLYFAMFKPAKEPHWKGNIKGYQIVNSQLVDYQTDPQPVLDDNGEIQTTAVSKWTTPSSPDGADITAGGAENKMPTPASRNIFTYLSGTSNDAVTATNNNITDTMLNASNATERASIIAWARGEGANRHIIGDPLHSQPAIVNYTSMVNDEEVVTPYMFFGTNDGYLHAINVGNGTAGGQEAFAFIPKELLGNLKTLMENTSSEARPYGLDGDITVGKINDRIYVFFGMRRGGNHYYALDVTDIDNPIFKWQISGGSGGTSGFTNLGQSWSKPLLAKVELNSATGPKEYAALIFGGGYDPQEDDPTFVRNINNAAQTYVGSSIYIVDALTGTKLWSAHGNDSGTTSTTELVIPEMDHAIPSSIAGLDLNVDGIVDRLYAIDIAGNMFRIDLNNRNDSDQIEPKGGRIADLREDTDTNPATYRRFYNEPEIVFTKYGAKRYLSLLVGSGYRAKPLETSIQNRFYSVRDEYVSDIPATYSSITESDLLDVTDASTTNMTGTTADPGILDKDGWYINLGSAEKALSSSLTVNNLLMFTTYTPSSSGRPSDSDPCKVLPPTGIAKFYGIDLLNAKPKAYLGENLRAKLLDKGGIPPSPSVVFTKDDISDNNNPDVQVIVGMEPISDNIGTQQVVNKLFWEER